jgi:short-subunit dehydrogenase
VEAEGRSREATRRVVLTGASSGIGRATALLFAERGAKLALAARGREPLEDVAREVGARGGEAIVVPTDVRDPDAVATLGSAAIEAFGGFDVWVNNAGVIAYGRFEDIPPDVFWGLIETNLRGQVNGARVALQHFRASGGGVLINMASVWGRLPSPYVTPYVTSKFALRAFSECLREELEDEPSISVATILPQSVDTPIFQHAANFSGRKVQPVRPLIDPYEVAEGILKCAENPKREVTHGRAGHLLEAFNYAMPGAWSRLAPRLMRRSAFGSEQVPRSSGNVGEATSGLMQVEGGWLRPGPLARIRRRLRRPRFRGPAGARR